MSCAGAAVAAPADGVYNFNGGWRLHVGEVANGPSVSEGETKEWKPVTLPHAFNEDDAFKKDIAELTTGISWYVKRLELPDGVGDKKLFLEFQGARFGARVWVNGKEAGRGENGVMAFGVDVTPYLQTGENTVAVRCDNAWNYKEESTGSSYEWNDRNFYANYGGLNKNVVLHVRGKVYQTLPLYTGLGTTGVYIYPTDMDVAKRSATINAESQVRNETGAAQQVVYQVRIRDLDGKEVAAFASAPVEVKAGETAVLTASGPASGLHFWSWGYGYLYSVTTSLSVDGKTVDSVDTKTGFRKTEFDHGAVKLNDRTLQMKGYGQRTTNEWPALGINLPPWVSDLSNGLMVESNGCLVRWMHVTPSKQDVESCDRVGLIESMPAGDSEKDVEGRRWEQRLELMRDAILYNRNNPSILFYEAGNHGISEDHMRAMVDLKNKYDPHGGRAMGCRDMMDSKVAEYGGEMLYINKSAGKPMWAMEYSRDEDLRKYADEFTPPYHKNGDGPDHGKESPFAYNRNQDSMAIETVQRWYDYYRERPGTGDRVSGGGVNIIFSDSNTHHRGAENYRRSGEVDAMRLPKEGFFAHQVMWNGWVDVEQPAAHIVGHWNYKPGTVKDTTVISSAERVELFVNGKSKGFGQQSSRFLFTFPKVAFEAGTLSAVGYDAGGAKVCSAEIKTAGEPAAIRLTPHVSPTGLKADGSDLALVDVEVVDANGQRCPTAFNVINFTLDGPAEWRGGIAQGPDNDILSKSLPVELGVNRVIVRSTPTAGAVTLHAATDGLPSTSLTLTSAAVPLDVWSAGLPSAGLVPSLRRGPTPAGDSVHPTRVSLKIASARSGASEKDPKLSYDDNESTSWSSDSSLSDAWIEYELVEPSLISELTLKLGAWRTRSYPLRVTVDGQEVFAGATPRSLGYVTLSLKPMTGKVVRVALIGAPRDRDDFDMTEITGLKQKAGTESGKTKAALSISEAELYGPLKEAR